MPGEIKWSTDVGDADFKAAVSYLQLVYAPGRAKALEKKMRGSKTKAFPAKDVIRASGLAALSSKDPEVRKQVEKIENQQPLSPILLVRDKDHTRLIVADGFHRLCAIVSMDAKALVHCKIV